MHERGKKKTNPLVTLLIRTFSWMEHEMSPMGSGVPDPHLVGLSEELVEPLQGRALLVDVGRDCFLPSLGSLSWEQ